MKRKISVKLVSVMAGALALLLVTTACQTAGPTASETNSYVAGLTPLSELEPVENPRELTGPANVQISPPDDEVISEDPSFEVPATVVSKDLDGTRPKIVVEDNSRIIALSVTGALAELVVSLGFGDNLIGKDIATTAPGTEDLPLVTNASHVINQEGVIALQPTLILTDGSIGPDDVVRHQLRDAGIPVVAIERIVDFESSYQAARDVSAALGAPELGEQLASEMEEGINNKIAEINEFVPSDPDKVPSIVFLYLRGSAGVFFMFGKGSGVDSIIQAVGARDIATDIGWEGERPLTPEALPQLNPDAILVMTKGLESVNGVEGLIADIPGVAQTTAGQNKRIISIDDTLLFAGGTRTPDVLEGLARVLYTDEVAG